MMRNTKSTFTDNELPTVLASGEVDDFDYVKEYFKNLDKHYLLIEGAAALPVAAFLKMKKDYKNKTVVLILSGKRIGLDTIQNILYQGVTHEAAYCQPGSNQRTA